jgi:hypothetical protein
VFDCLWLVSVIGNNSPKKVATREEHKGGGGSTWGTKGIERMERHGKELLDHWRNMRREFALYEKRKMEMDLKVAAIDARSQFDAALREAQAADR